MSTIKVSPMRSQTTIEKAARSIYHDGNRITFDFSHTSVVQITTLSGDGHACQVTLSSREWHLLNKLRDTIDQLKMDI